MNMDLNPDNYKNISNEYLNSDIINIYNLLLNNFNDANKETQESQPAPDAQPAAAQ